MRNISQDTRQDTVIKRSKRVHPNELAQKIAVLKFDFPLTLIFERKGRPRGQLKILDLFKLGETSWTLATHDRFYVVFGVGLRNLNQSLEKRPLRVDEFKI